MAKFSPTLINRDGMWNGVLCRYRDVGLNRVPVPKGETKQRHPEVAHNPARIALAEIDGRAIH